MPKPRPPKPIPHPDVAAGGVRRTRYYMHAFIDSLRECGHQPSDVRQVLRELLDGDVSMAFCPACFVQVTPEQAGAQLNALHLLDECSQFLKDGETPAECIARNRKDAAAVFLYYSDAHRWRYVRDHWDDVGGISFPREGFRPSWTAPSDPDKLTAFVDEKRKGNPANGPQNPA